MTLEDLFPHAEVVASAIGPDVAERLRASLTGFQRFALYDRGSYDVAPVTDPDLLDRICGLGARRIGKPLTAISARAIRLRAGDYLLAHHDHAPAGRPLELVLDLSPAPVRQELQYRRLGQVFLRVPCSPCSLAVVERTPAISCNHTYVSKLALGAEVIRLIVLASSPSPRG
jgi:hypothetical protein